MIKMIHSYWAYIVLIILIIAVVNALLGFTSKKEFKAKDLRISLFALIASHIQLIIGFLAYYNSAFYESMRTMGMGEVMKNSELRKPLVEHPLLIIVAIALITIGFSKHKKKTTDVAKFKTIIIFYGIALLLILAVIPWNLWFTK
jgi:heme A synthase